LVAGLLGGVILGLALAKASQAVLDSINENPQYPTLDVTDDGIPVHPQYPTLDVIDDGTPVHMMTTPVPTLGAVQACDAVSNHPLPPQDAVLQYNLQ